MYMEYATIREYIEYVESVWRMPPYEYMDHAPSMRVYGVCPHTLYMECEEYESLQSMAPYDMESRRPLYIEYEEYIECIRFQIPRGFIQDSLRIL